MSGASGSHSGPAHTDPTGPKREGVYAIIAPATGSSCSSTTPTSDVLAPCACAMSRMLSDCWKLPSAMRCESCSNSSSRSGRTFQ